MKRKWFLQPGRVPHLLTILSIFPEREEFYAFWVEQFPKLKVKFQVFFTNKKENIWRLPHLKTIPCVHRTEISPWSARSFHYYGPGTKASAQPIGGHRRVAVAGRVATQLFARPSTAHWLQATRRTSRKCGNKSWRTCGAPTRNGLTSAHLLLHRHLLRLLHYRPLHLLRLRLLHQPHRRPFQPLHWRRDRVATSNSRTRWPS